MNREIKFRGWNAKNQRWLYGYYFVNRGESFIVKDEIQNPFVTPDDFLVAPETIGQFTGLKDKNGKEIYEGDVVSTGHTRGVVVYNSTSAYFMVEKADSRNLELRFYALIGIEVIGNIHDNHELLQ